MKLVSWNVNGLRAVLNKGFMDFFNEMDADVVCLQETKMQPGQVELDMPGYHQYFHSGERKGYSSTALFRRWRIDEINKIIIQNKQKNFSPIDTVDFRVIKSF